MGGMLNTASSSSRAGSGGRLRVQQTVYALVHPKPAGGVSSEHNHVGAGQVVVFIEIIERSS